ncbi:MAG: NAD(P)-binding domain-containing protein [Rubrobacteraceae bacterium]
MENVGVVGLGYVGLPLALEFAEAGLGVVGVEKDPKKLSALRAGESYVEDVASERLAPLVSSGAVRATDDYAALGEVDAVIICLPTPLDDNREPDLSMLVAGARETARTIGPGTLVVLESTTYPRPARTLPSRREGLLRRALGRGALAHRLHRRGHGPRRGGPRPRGRERAPRGGLAQRRQR